MKETFEKIVDHLLENGFFMEEAVEILEKTLIARVTRALRPGSIILLHDGGGDRAKTVKALPAILAAVAKAGYRPVTVTQLLNDAPPQRDDLAAGT